MSIQKRHIIVIDQTIREGMQHRGIMFGFEERLKMIHFQNQLRVDIAQVAYPSAHPSEQACLAGIQEQCTQKAYAVQPAGLGRAWVDDALVMAATGIRQFHLHTGATQPLLDRFGEDRIRTDLAEAVACIRDNAHTPVIHVSLVDVGKTDRAHLISLSSFLCNDLKVDILTLPDTSGIMTPKRYHDMIAGVCKATGSGKTRIGVHCHNDLGMANANTVMGVLAGASVIEVSALGIGERNGIADLFVVGKTLQHEGYPLLVDIDNVAGFQDYYHYVNNLYLKQTGEPALTFNTPYFGASAATHVAGTHGVTEFGIHQESGQTHFYFNVLTGRRLVQKFATQNGLDVQDDTALEAAKAIKDASAQWSRSLTAQEVIAIIKEKRKNHPFVSGDNQHGSEK